MNNNSTQTDILKTELLVNTVQELSLSDNIGDIMKIVRTVARKLTGADGATFVLKEGDLCYYADEDAISPLWKGSRFPMETCISGWVMMNKEHAAIPDIYLDKRIPHDAYRPTFVKSLAMVPIRKIEPIGAIGCYWATIHSPTEEEIALIQSLADITSVSVENINIRNELKKKLKERSRMLDQLTEQKKQLEEFTHIIAHNLRAPISNLMLIGDLILESQDMDEKIDFLNKQKTVLDHLHQVFDELIDTIQVKTDFSIERNHVVLEDIWKKAIELLQGDIIRSKAIITSDFSNAPTAYFPLKYIESILFNLLSNALKYRSPERIPEITVKSYKKDKWTYIEISDNGLGIDLKKHGDKIFKLRKTFHEHPDAKGFGLFITKTQIEAMNGEIRVESTPGVGSTFIIKLNKNKQL